MININNKIILVELFINSIYDLLLTELEENVENYNIINRTLEFIKEININIEKFLKDSILVFELIKREILINLLKCM